MTAEPSITCPRCGRTSYNPGDIREGYCGYCHDWTSAPAPVAPVAYEAALDQALAALWDEADVPPEARGEPGLDELG